jgi:hypothetical protein
VGAKERWRVRSALTLDAREAIAVTSFAVRW